VPEFTVEFVDNSYDVPPTYSFKIDQYSGEEVNTTIPGYRVENQSIVVTIKKQPFTPYTDEEGHKIELSYSVRVKGHFEEYWNTLSSSSITYSDYSDPEYTVMSFPLGEGADAYQLTKLTAGDKIDFKVQASIGYSTLYNSDTGSEVNPEYKGPLYRVYSVFTGEHSDWSATQTLTIPPRVTLLLPQNGNFSSSNIPLDFAVDGEASQIEYSLDGGDNVTISGNMTLTGLSNGDHNLTLYTTDEFGNTGVSETIYFTVDVPFPTTLVLASVITAAVGIGLLVYFKKRKH
jgi:hypothetical protein